MKSGGDNSSSNNMSENPPLQVSLREEGSSFNLQPSTLTGAVLLLLLQAIFTEEETVEATREVELSLQEATTEELLDQVMAATFLLSLRRRWPSFKYTWSTSKSSKIRISEEINLNYFYPHIV
jgi:hypothetical protein